MKFKNTTLRPFIAITAISGALLGGAHAATIAEFDYNPALGTSLSPSTVIAVASVTPLTLTNPGNTATAFGNHFYHNNWSATIDLGKYYETTVTNIDDGRFDINCMNFSMESTSGTSNWHLRSSDDGFASGLENIAVVNDSADANASW